MAGGCVHGLGKVALSIRVIHSKTRIGGQPILGEIEPMLDKHRAGVCVVSNAIPSNPGIHHRQREKEYHDQEFLVFSSLEQTLLS
jgi:hypothetical protein